MKRTWYSIKWFVKDRLTVRRFTRSQHGGLGYAMGDGVDIEDEVIEFGIAPHVWLRILCSVTVTTKGKTYVMR